MTSIEARGAVRLTEPLRFLWGVSAWPSVCISRPSCNTTVSSLLSAASKSSCVRDTLRTVRSVLATPLSLNADGGDRDWLLRLNKDIGVVVEICVLTAASTHANTPRHLAPNHDLDGPRTSPTAHSVQRAVPIRRRVCIKERPDSRDLLLYTRTSLLAIHAMRCTRPKSTRYVSLIAHVIHLVHAPASLLTCYLVLVSALAAKRSASKTSVHKASTARLAQQQQMKQESEPDKKQGDDEGWVSSDEDDELDEDEILVLQTQRAQRNAREAEKLKAAAKAAEAEILAKQREDEDSEQTEDSNGKHSDMPALPVESPSSLPRGKPSLPAKQPPTEAKPQLPPAAPKQPQAQTTRQPLPSHHTETVRPHPEPSRLVPTLAPVIQHVPDHTKHTFPSKAKPSTLIPQANGTHDKAPPHDHSSDHHHQRPDDRPNTRRSHSHMIKPAVPTREGLTLLPLLLVHILSFHKYPPHPLRDAIHFIASTYSSTQSFEFYTHPPNSPSLTHRSPHYFRLVPPALTTLLTTTSFKPIPERERTVSAVSSAAALHAIHNHNPHRKPHRSLGAVATSTFPPEPADTYNGGMYPGSGSSLAAPGGTSAVVGASGGMYGGKPGPVHSLLPAPYMATHMSVGRWYAPARDAVGRVVRGRPSS
ncbi:hypothetical protein RHS01_09097 [Rhizoctonia solani]|uniref:Uncharacterized protein n=1 Tax=Rhizoctonia solani TaxID=456999 RepID=A0A8H7I523_9AGAM|nr:hypothetical protein RHS01_09097 [Rhizoctonia solani]